MRRPAGPAALAAGAVLFILLVPAAAADASVVATDDGAGARNRFEPAEFTVAPGEAIAVSDRGRDLHTLTAVQAGAWEEVVVKPGETKSFAAPRTAGDYRFYCRFHASPGADAARGEMAGVLHVAAAGASPAAPPPATRPAPDLGALPLLALAAFAAVATRRTGR